MNNTRFIGFTSAAGGSGCSSSMILFARTLSGSLKKKVLVISMDVIASKMAPKAMLRKSSKKLLTRMELGSEKYKQIMESCIIEDDFGVFYITDEAFYNPFYLLGKTDLINLMKKISECDFFDVVLLDIPFKNIASEDLCACCEDVVVVSGYINSQIACNNELYMHLDFYFKSLVFRPRLSIFAPVNDCESFDGSEVDIHGHLGAEVRELVSELFGE